MKSQLGQRVVGTTRRIPSTWSKHTSRDCIVWDREEKECRAVGFSRGGIFHLCQPPLDALAAPARLSRTLYVAATLPPRRSRLCPSPSRSTYTWSRYRAHDHEEKRERERKNDTTALERASMERRCQTCRHLIVESRLVSSRLISFSNLPNKIFEIYLLFLIALAICINICFNICFCFNFVRVCTFKRFLFFNTVLWYWPWRKY